MVRTLDFGQKQAYQLLPYLHSTSSGGTSQLAAQIGSIIPEAYDNENVDRATMVIRGPGMNMAPEYIKMVFFILSNNFGHLETRDSGENWHAVVGLLKNSGIMQGPIQLGPETGVTTIALMERLLRAAFSNTSGCKYPKGIRAMMNPQWRDEDRIAEKKLYSLIAWLLSSGLDPNSPVLVKGERWTPLQLAVNRMETTIMSQLLDSMADPNLTYDRADPPLAIMVKNLRHLQHDKFLRDKSPRINMASISAAYHECRASSMKMLGVLMEKGANISQIYHPQFPNALWFTGKRSILGYTAELEVESRAIEAFSYLLEKAKQSSSTTLGELIYTDVALIAARTGHNKFLSHLHSLGVDITKPGDLGFSALHVAARHGHISTCRLLLQHKIPVDGHLWIRTCPSPLVFASYGLNIQIVKLLHQHGADIDFRFDTNDDTLSFEVFFPRVEKLPQDDLESPLGLILAKDHRGINEKLFRKVLRYLADNGATMPKWAAFRVARTSNPNILTLMQTVLRGGADPNWTPGRGRTALQSVLMGGKTMGRSGMLRLEAATALLDAGARVSCLEVQKSLFFGDRDMTEKVLRLHDLNDHKCETLKIALGWALESMNREVAEEILALSPGLYDAEVLCASVYYARNHGNAIVQQLLRNRGRLASCQPFEGTAVGVAAFYGMADTLNLLLSTFKTPVLALLPRHKEWELFWDSEEGSPEEVEDIIRITLFTELQESFHVSPLFLALRSESSMEKLLAHGYRPDKLAISMASAMNDASVLQKLGQFDRLLVDCPFPGPMSVAVTHGKVNTVQILLEMGEDINEDNSKVMRGRSPLQAAVETGNLVLIDLFLKAGAEINAPAARNCGATALQLAAINGQLGIARALVDLGADINASGAELHGRTALEGAAEHGRLDMAQYLLSQGAWTDGKGRLQYLRAIRYAQLNGKTVLANLLRKHREWTADDEELWTELKSLSREKCEKYEHCSWDDYFVFEEDALQGHEGMGLEGAIDAHEAEGGVGRTEDGSPNLTYDDAKSEEVLAYTAWSTAHFEDLEMMTRDPWVFSSEP